jgi:hypothetical protein
VVVKTNPASGPPLRKFFQKTGTMTLSEDPTTTGHLVGTITNLSLIEVTIDQSTFLSTPVPGGQCLRIADVTLNDDAVPDAWSCAKTAYRDGMCDCMCGVSDPDCNASNFPANNCPAAQACAFDGTCVARPANDTCQAAAPLTLGVSSNGTTVGASSNYSAGLETCDSMPQPGPDVAYSVSLVAGTAYTFTLSGLDSGFDASLSLVGPGVTSCDATPITCLAGADVNGPGSSESFVYTPTTNGTYFVIVDSASLSAGGFTLKVM